MEESLVAEVKTLQRSNDVARQQWSAYCAAQGGGKCDPAKHTAAFLKNFITNFNAGVVFDADGSIESMIAEVKRLQREDPSAKQRWVEYCDSQGGRIRDPAKHDASFLEAFLNDGTVGLGAGRVEVSGSSVQELVEHIKQLQRNDPSFSEQWREFCSGQPGRSRDPANYDAGTLSGFLDSVRAGSGRVAGSGPSPLVELFKEGQRRSQKFRAAWANYCELYVGGKCDPAAHSPHSFERFFDFFGDGVMSGMASAGVQRTSTDVANQRNEAPAAKRARTDGFVPSASLGGTLKDDLVQRVKGYQRAGGSEAWNDYCKQFAADVRDPSKHDEGSLAYFVEVCQVP